jgi:ATP-dependent helicase HrpA
MCPNGDHTSLAGDPDPLAPSVDAARLDGGLDISVESSLPIADRAEEILAALAAHQVLIVAGETGSGKSTQLPKLCLQAGRGRTAMIGHTQPRRVAARTIAERIADEMGTTLGAGVGYAVRFTDTVSAATRVKVMTDGILLAEIQRDRMLRRYDTLIIDEAHERSLNIDFLLGYLTNLLPRRPDLKLIVTSATIDTERFAEHFSAPVIEVTGRTYPVEMRYRPLDEGADQVQAIVDAVDELRTVEGDVLVFLSGEREIHDTADALRKHDANRRGGAPLEVLPLYARLSSAEQHRIFRPHAGRRIVLATNVAETSITVPGVRSVVDTGVARISRYSHRLKVQRLPIEPVSQASADQRAGRCGRVAPGVCIRLYEQDDFEGRAEFTEPEILRTNLASVILQMTALGLGDIAAFPFIEPPDPRAIRDGVALLEELGALVPDDTGANRRLTSLGRRLARLPIDPRLGRMVIEAERHGCVREVLVIVAALSIQDPRERPADRLPAAEEMHRRFRVDGSDFLSWVALWDHLRTQQKEMSSSAFRRMCRNEFLSYLRVREWQDLYSQLRRVAGELGIRPGTDVGHPDRVHQALLAGLLSQIGMRDDAQGGREFRGARGARFQIARSSAIAKKPPRWVMAAELVETNRLWARTVSAIQPEWAERLAPHLVRYSYDDATWDAERGSAVTVERAVLFGLPIVPGRRVLLGRVDTELAREMLIRHALVDGDWHTSTRVVLDNRALVDGLRELEDRVRRRDHLVDDEVIASFYDQRLPADITTGRHLDRWLRDAEQAAMVRMTPEDLAPPGSAPAGEMYPDTWRVDGMTLGLAYTFDPGSDNDGVTVSVPLHAVHQIDPDPFTWQVPGFRGQLIDALVRSLPKDIRRLLVPLADTAADAARALTPEQSPLTTSLAAFLSQRAGITIAPTAFDVARIPDHLRVSFAVVDGVGERVAFGKDLAELRRSLAAEVRAAVAASTRGLERRGIVEWDMGTIAEVVESERDGVVVRGYPALLDDGDSVSLRVFTSPAVQQRIMVTGVRRLLLLAVPVNRKSLRDLATNDVRLAFGRLGLVTLDQVVEDCVRAAADAVMAGRLVWNEDDFVELRRRARDHMPRLARSAMTDVCAVVLDAAVVQAQCERLTSARLAPNVADARTHLERLVRPGLVTSAGVERVADLRRYVQGIARRLDRIAADPVRDRQRSDALAQLQVRYGRLLERLPPSQIDDEIRDIRWQIEELRISEFAQMLGVKGKVSARRIEAALAVAESRV